MTSNCRFTVYSIRENLRRKNQYFSEESLLSVKRITLYTVNARVSFVEKNNTTIYHGSSTVAVVSGRVSQWFENTIVQYQILRAIDRVKRILFSAAIFPVLQVSEVRYRRARGPRIKRFNQQGAIAYPDLSRSICASTTDRLVIDIRETARGSTDLRDADVRPVQSALIR